MYVSDGSKMGTEELGLQSIYQTQGDISSSGNITRSQHRFWDGEFHFF